MRIQRTRLLRGGLLALVVVVGALVAHGLRRPAPEPGPPASAPAAAQGATRVGELVFLRFREGERAVELKARAMLGQEGEAQRFSGVEVRLPFVAEGRANTVTIAADEGLYQAEPERANFKGHVRLRTDDGFELETESLRYRAQPQLEIRGDQPLVFRRGRSSGSAQSAHYRADGGLQLSGEVKLRIDDDSGVPTEVASPLASASREQGLVWFEGGVVVRRGSSELRSQRLQLNLTPDRQAIERAAAIEDAELVLGAAATGGAGGETGRRRLRGRRINLTFRAAGVFEQVSAVNPASLEALPGPGEPRERRLITSAVLTLSFDELGRLQGLTAQGRGSDGPPEQQRTVVLIEPLSGHGPKRRIESRSLNASFDPGSGELQRADFEQDVRFREPGRSARSESARYEQAEGRVTLEGGGPQLLDEGQAGELRARQIRVGTRGRSVSASGDVRHTLTGRGVPAGEEPPVVLCQQFDYEPLTRTARYREGAVLRSGRDEIRAPVIEIEEPAAGRRRLRAAEGVSSTFVPRPKPGARQPAAAIAVRSQDLVYDEQGGRAVYSGEVEIRQGDIVTRSPQAVASLTPGGGVERVDASSPVEVRQGRRLASGERGSYTPKDETFVLEGESVVLREGERSLTGRILIFQSGSDRIRVDGRDEMRSEAIFQRSDTRRP